MVNKSTVAWERWHEVGSNRSAFNYHNNYHLWSLRKWWNGTNVEMKCEMWDKCGRWPLFRRSQIWGVRGVFGGQKLSQPRLHQLVPEHYLWTNMQYAHTARCPNAGSVTSYSPRSARRHYNVLRKILVCIRVTSDLRRFWTVVVRCVVTAVDRQTPSVPCTCVPIYGPRSYHSANGSAIHAL